jgi:hypothetical protein
MELDKFELSTRHIHADDFDYVITMMKADGWVLDGEPAYPADGECILKFLRRK